MKTLVIDTATKACSVALYDGDEVIAAAHEVIGRGHAERLLPLIAALPDRGKADRIYVDVGPGSFTGIRVGLAAAKALAFAWQVPVHGFGCLSLVAAMAVAEIGHEVPIDVVMTGGHGEYYFEQFGLDGQSLSPAVSLSPQNVWNLSDRNHVAGDIDPGGGGPVWHHLLPDARQWHLLADAAPLTPSPAYVRPPDAKPTMAAA
ncbi:MAG: tRNA (adenosine(37)-N6)-threonylcarbamoyltransferase complex dimerization subunit type 1 TsaB [Sphingomonadaceae bacterium]|nr:tRNA (adenosine(37)-N6)-threonylcarbamoyltransferase complex dimerization subunit type 1 TsaB [Sphingomonadaceae bacterium]